MAKYFGTDGVRGTVGQWPMTVDFTLKLASAAARVLAPDGGTVLIGKDTRISGYVFESVLEAGFAAAGVDVRLLGPMPTPAIAYLTRTLHARAGVVISASHNPYMDNGIKFFSAAGTKLPDAIEAAIEAELDCPMTTMCSERLGKVERVVDAAGRYIEFCKSTFPNSLDLRGLKLVVDCAHGAAYHVAPAVFHELGAEVVAIGAEPNGFNINDGVGAVHPEALVHAVRESGADLGIAVDGDADRLILVDGEGTQYNGDQLLYVIVRDRMRDGPVAGAVGTLMTNFALERRLAELKVPFARAKVGDRYVLELLRERGWFYGGENSGHIICLDRHTTGDGIVSALQVLAAMRESGQQLPQLTAALKLYPQVLINVRVPQDFDWAANGAIRRAQSDAERALDGRGRVLLRASGTEPVLRVMVEAQDGTLARRCAERLAEAVRGG